MPIYYIWLITNIYKYSVLIEQEGHECLFDSGRFKINSNQY